MPVLYSSGSFEHPRHRHGRHARTARSLIARNKGLATAALLLLLWALWAIVLPIGAYGFLPFPTGYPRANLR